MTRAADHAHLDLTAAPADLLAAWPRSLPLVALHSGRLHPRWSRYSVFTTPSGFFRIDASGRAWLADAGADERPVAQAQPLEALAAVLAEHRRPHAGDRTGDTPPFTSGWVGFFGYELGRLLEPAVMRCRPTARRRDAGRTAALPQAWPLAELARCDGALIFDALHHRWCATGAWSRDLPEPLAAAVARLGEGRRPGPSEPRTSASSAYRVSGLSLRRDRAAHEAAVARTIEYIRAGDIFQANMTRPIRFDFRGSSRALFRQAAAVAPAWYGAYLELPNGRCLLSLSPELYLQVDADGAVQTRPIKGTRPAGVDAAELRASEKDAAELNMIIDLSRNDLGRVCELGSVRVSQPREVETHPTVHHGVATIEGRLREGCGICDLLAASFPGGSITGAPKIRAMQIIEELETTPRGPYCGAIGFLDDAGAARLNIAIRTLTLHGSTTAPGVYEQAAGVYSVGGGIVADSDPAAEYEETVAKAAVLQRLAAPLVPYDARAGSDLSIFSETACPGVDLPL